MLTPDELRSFPWKSLSWLIVNEGELETLLESLSSSPAATSGDLIADARARIETLHSSPGFSKNVSVICTLGARGILYYRAGASGEIPHLPAGKVLGGVKDTTGAGDCFAGYFAAGLMREGEEKLEEVLKTCLTVRRRIPLCLGAKRLMPGVCYLRGEPRSDGELRDKGGGACSVMTGRIVTSTPGSVRLDMHRRDSGRKCMDRFYPQPPYGASEASVNDIDCR